MQKRLSSEKKNEICKRMIYKYLEKVDVYDYLEFANGSDLARLSNMTMKQWMDFAKDNLTQQEYSRFCDKMFILDIKPEDRNVKEKEELKSKVIEISQKIAQNEATIFDVIDKITPSMSKYIYMLKLLTFRHNIVSKSIYAQNLKYYKTTKNYTQLDNATASFPGLDKTAQNKIVKFINDYGLPINDITLIEAYRTCKIRGIIKINKQAN